jgi:hypothetical protein
MHEKGRSAQHCQLLIQRLPAGNSLSLLSLKDQWQEVDLTATRQEMRPIYTSDLALHFMHKA